MNIIDCTIYGRWQTIRNEVTHSFLVPCWHSHTLLNGIATMELVHQRRSE